MAQTLKVIRVVATTVPTRNNVVGHQPEHISCAAMATLVAIAVKNKLA